MTLTKSYLLLSVAEAFLLRVCLAFLERIRRLAPVLSFGWGQARIGLPKDLVYRAGRIYLCTE